MSAIPRLYVEDDLLINSRITLTSKASHYLGNVLRLQLGGKVYLFNGRDGEWLCKIIEASRKKLTVLAVEKIRNQEEEYNLHYIFAPIKRARMDYMIQKAVEMGAGVIQPMISEYTQVKKVKTKRIISNAIEAAEQSGVMNIPKVYNAVSLDNLLNNWDKNKYLIFCDEGLVCDEKLGRNKINTKSYKKLSEIEKKSSVGIMLGPEGGFSTRERKIILSYSFVVPISLGPRIMRADTAAVAALALYQASAGDWY